MRFKIKEIGEDGLPLDLAILGSWLARECPDLDAKPAPTGLAFRGRIDRASDDFILHGRVRGALEAPCARCLEPARVPLDVEIADTFSERAGAAAEDDEADLLPIEGDEIDVGPSLRDEIMLAVPVGPLCREDCRGLCPVCGGNRNQTPCDCESRQRIHASPLSAALRNLKS